MKRIYRAKWGINHEADISWKGPSGNVKPIKVADAYSEDIGKLFDFEANDLSHARMLATRAMKADQGMASLLDGKPRWENWLTRASATR